MSRYVVRIVQRDGNPTFLVRGKLTDWQERATHYPHPSSAERARLSFMKGRHPGNYYSDVIDTRDPERTVQI